MGTVRIKKPSSFESEARTKSPAQEMPAPVVSPRDFRNAFASSVRGQAAVPEWAGKTVYASEKAYSYWSAQDNEVASLASFAKLISDNHELLAEIERGSARSIAEIARTINRQQSNVSRSLTKLEKCGVVRLEDASEGRSKTPKIISRHLFFQLDIVSGNVELAPVDATLKDSGAARPIGDDRAVHREKHASANHEKHLDKSGGTASEKSSKLKSRRRVAER